MTCLDPVEIAKIIDPEPWEGTFAGLNMTKSQRDVALHKADRILAVIARTNHQARDAIEDELNRKEEALVKGARDLDTIPHSLDSVAPLALADRLANISDDLERAAGPAWRGAALSASERHELECLRHQVGQLEYPCSPHCEGYLRELAMRNGGSRP
jgi:hypothetical protein